MSRRHGPEPKAKGDRRGNRISVFLTNGEKAELAKKAGKMSLPDFLRRAGLGQRPPKPMPEIHIQLWRNLARVGSNLNQIAHHLNIGDDVELDHLRNVILTLRQKLDEVRSNLKGGDYDSKN